MNDRHICAGAGAAICVCPDGVVLNIVKANFGPGESRLYQVLLCASLTVQRLVLGTAYDIVCVQRQHNDRVRPLLKEAGLLPGDAAAEASAVRDALPVCHARGHGLACEFRLSATFVKYATAISGARNRLTQ
jgi:hypothetical protein